MATTTLRREFEYISPTRQWVMGGIFLVAALAIWLLFSRTVEPGTVTTYGMTLGGTEAVIPDWKVPSLATLNLLTIVCAILGFTQLVKPRGFGRRTNLILGLVAGMFIFGFLTWSAAGKSLSLVALMSSTL